MSTARRGRPRGEVSAALLRVVGELATPEQGVTLREAAARACVGVAAARITLHNLTRSGALVIVRTRRVPYRNKPVAEYAPATPLPEAAVPSGFDALLTAWGGPVSANE